MVMKNTGKHCRDGLIISAPEKNLFNTIICLFGLLYCFIGVATASNIFMRSIERIASTTRRVKKKSEGKLKNDALLASQGEEYENIYVWNPTVANLTLMALGSSAPEILLSIIEIVGNSFKSGELGPGTIVGSAAFNLLCITSICTLVIPSPRVSQIKEMVVFGITSFFSCFAYIWLFIILTVISPNVVEIWEAAITLAFFFILIVVAYLADIKIWKKEKMEQKFDFEDEIAFDSAIESKKMNMEEIDKKMQQLAERKMAQHYMDSVASYLQDDKTIRSIARQISRIYPSLSADEKAKLIAYKINKNKIRNRLLYRIKATGWLSGAHRKNKIIENNLEMKAKTLDEAIIERSIEFSARVYSIQEADQYVKLRILRHGPTDTSVTFRYTTKNGAAKKDLHFLQKSETERFSPGESIKEIYIGLIAEASWRAEHVFYVQLRIESNENSENKTVLGKISVASVRKPDLSSSFIGEPMVQFVQRNYMVKESEGYVRAFVTRIGRHDKKNFLVHYYTEGITAISDIDFQAVTDGTLNFADSEYEKFIDIRIFDDMQEEKDETFVIQLSNPSQDITIGPNNKAVVTIMCDDNILKNIKDISKLTTYYLDNMIHGANNWYEQIVEATSVNSGDTVNATFLDCILHVIAFPWKIIVALIPPPMICGGWLCFFIALSIIGLITAIIGDFANIFGCMVGLKDTATAITLVALGTSLPDTIASKIAAENDRTADNAIGNITGSNSVNVFLGLGLPWLIASIYWSTKNENFVVNAGDLGFSVALFTITSVLYHLMLTLRRNIAFFGNAELGGPICPKLFSAFFIFSLWLAYIFLSILKTYGRVIDV